MRARLTRAQGYSTNMFQSYDNNYYGQLLSGERHAVMRVMRFSQALGNLRYCAREKILARA